MSPGQSMEDPQASKNGSSAVISSPGEPSRTVTGTKKDPALPAENTGPDLQLMYPTDDDILFACLATGVGVRTNPAEWETSTNNQQGGDNYGLDQDDGGQVYEGSDTEWQDATLSPFTRVIAGPARVASTITTLELNNSIASSSSGDRV